MDSLAIKTQPKFEFYLLTLLLYRSINIHGNAFCTSRLSVMQWLLLEYSGMVDGILLIKLDVSGVQDTGYGDIGAAYASAANIRSAHQGNM